MCFPPAAVSAFASLGSFGAQTALTIGAQVAQHVAASQQARYQQRWQDRESSLARAAAIDEALLNYGSLQRRTSEERTAVARDIQRVARESALAAGTARTRAAEAGVSGGSVAAILRGFAAEEARYRTEAVEGLRATEAQVADIGRSVERRTAARLAGTVQPRIQGPSVFATALRIGAGVGQAYLSTHTYIPGQGWVYGRTD